MASMNSVKLANSFMSDFDRKMYNRAEREIESKYQKEKTKEEILLKKIRIIIREELDKREESQVREL